MVKALPAAVKLAHCGSWWTNNPSPSHCTIRARPSFSVNPVDRAFTSQTKRAAADEHNRTANVSAAGDKRKNQFCVHDKNGFNLFLAPVGIRVQRFGFVLNVRLFLIEVSHGHEQHRCHSKDIDPEPIVCGSFQQILPANGDVRSHFR